MTFLQVFPDVAFAAIPQKDTLDEYWPSACGAPFQAKRPIARGAPLVSNRLGGGRRQGTQIYLSPWMSHLAHQNGASR